MIKYIIDMKRSFHRKNTNNGITTHILQFGLSEVYIASDFGCNIMDALLDGQRVIDGNTELKRLQEDYLCKSDFLLPYPNRISDGVYIFEDKEYQLNKNEVARGHALHGCFMFKIFSLEHIAEEESKITATFKTTLHENEYTGYPFQLDSYISISLGEKELSVTIKTINTDTKNAPYGVGWHPYITANKRIDDCTLRVPAKSIMETSIEKELIPTGTLLPNEFGMQSRKLKNTQFDTCFADMVDQMVRFENIEMWMDESMKYIQIYTPEDRQSIAIEPMSCAPDAYNNGLGLIVLRPGESATHQFGLRIKSD